MKCLSCGVYKDMSVKEVYPRAEEDGLTSEPIEPLVEIECSGDKDFRAVLVCFDCYHRLQPDMWISENCWKRLNPLVRYEELPILIYGELDYHVSIKLNRFNRFNNEKYDLLSTPVIQSLISYFLSNML